MIDDEIFDHESGKKNTDGLSSMFISPKSVVEKPSILSIFAGGSNELNSMPIKKKADETKGDKEEQFFNSLLTRKSDFEKYQIIQKVAAGGMGTVYYAYDQDIERNSILKVILPQHKDNQLLIRSFIKEAKITGQLEHPNIVPVHDIGYLDDYGIYFSMKFIQGESLYDIIKKLEKKNKSYIENYDLYFMLNIFRKVCDAVSFAHSTNIIHRDIKPANIMVGNYGEVLLMDWGMAKEIVESSEDSLNKISPNDLAPKTQYGVVKGTPAYMPPEQASGEVGRIDFRSDIFLLGACLYQMFTYNPPFIGCNLREIIYKSRKCEFIPPDSLLFKNLQIPLELSRIIKKAMAHDSTDRYQSVQELASDVDDVLHGKMEFHTRSFSEGEYLLREGEMGIDSYIIIKGHVKVFKTAESGVVELGTLTEGGTVGEMALITNEPRTASVVALEQTETLVLNKDLFTHNLKKLPSWMEKIIISLADRLSASNAKLAEYRH